MGFLTKTLPRLGKAFDKALSGATRLTASEHRFPSMPGSELPRFLGEFFSRVLDRNGVALQEPCVNSVRVIRQILFVFYKYELPYSDEQEQQVIDRFKRTDRDLSSVTSVLANYRQNAVDDPTLPFKRRTWNNDVPCFAFPKERVVREARILLSRLFASFDPKDIYPRHGPGAVATKQRLWNKYRWTNVSAKITSVYPLDEYFYLSVGHVCDRLQELQSLHEESLPARVCLVPKDSRGPRLISCEPVDYQWIQQGLGRAIVELVEAHPLTKWNVHFTDQGPNQKGALLGSYNGRYATLDLNEASDRVSLELVRLLFPDHVFRYLEACRSSSTILPDGSELTLQKFAPMGSCLCFPVLAITVWALLTAGMVDTDSEPPNRDVGVLVYGDDVVVPTAYAECAIERLESFGLKVNRDKSCTSGFFRESCGIDAFHGQNVTPVRLRTVWSSAPSASVYTSWIAYANSFYDRGYYATYDFIVRRLHRVYGAIPGDDMNLSCPSLRVVDEEMRPNRRRVNSSLQKLEWRVRDVKSPSIRHETDGWSMLLRYFSECGNDRNRIQSERGEVSGNMSDIEPFSAGSYTRRKTSMLVYRWR